MFNVGDRVRINRKVIEHSWIGEEGTVASITEDGLIRVKTDNILLGTFERGFVRLSSRKFDLIEDTSADPLAELFVTA